MKISLLSIAALISSCSAFSVENGSSRRNFLSGGAAAVAGTLLAPQVASAAFGAIPKDSVVQREMNSFRDLISNFKDTTLNGGLDASKINEPSVSFLEFGEQMKNGQVDFVEFMAPEGNVAYATFKAKKGETETSNRIRIGEGYPTTSKNSWSSPDYVIRSVSNFGVPYKFTVPALAKYSSKKPVLAKK
jgi:hypothetical protein